MYPKGGVGPHKTGIQWPTETARLSGIAAGFEELYLRYYVYFEDGFDFKIGGKLPGLMSAGGAGAYEPDGSNGWLMRFMWRENAKAEVYSLLPPSKFNNFKSSLDVHFNFKFSTGKWYCIEQYVRLNSIGSDDGKLKVWIDGVNLLDRSDVLYRTVDNEKVKIGGFYFSTFHGGDTVAWAPSVDSYARFDAVVLSKERIGCIDSGPARPDAGTAVRSAAEMLVNGNFADGTSNWVVMESGATGRAAIVAEGPDGKAALRLKVLTIGDQSWLFRTCNSGARDCSQTTNRDLLFPGGCSRRSSSHWYIGATGRVSSTRMRPSTPWPKTGGCSVVRAATGAEPGTRLAVGCRTDGNLDRWM